ncbi:MAG: DUF2807 domain-containing protein [Maribacter sp.]|uniref:GIN domain-containing protein n=1 Tax=Maribacter sp. TaxID=1897614 RepID=UPI00329A2D93
MLEFKISKERKSAKKFLTLALAFIFSSLYVLLAQEEKRNELSSPEFQAIHVSGVAKVFFTQEAHKEIEMIVSGDPYPQVIRKIKNGVLEIYTEGEAHNEVVEVFVSNPSLTSISVSDRAEFHSVKNMEMKTLRIEVKDVASANIGVDVEKVAIHMDGGDLTISGITSKQDITRSRQSSRGTLDNSRLKIVQ